MDMRYKSTVVAAVIWLVNCRQLYRHRAATAYSILGRIASAAYINDLKIARYYSTQSLSSYSSPIARQDEFHIQVNGSCDPMSIFLVELFENHGNEGRVAKTDHSAIVIAGDHDAEELPYWTMVHDLVFLRSLRLDPDRCCGGRLRTGIYYGDVINTQKDDNAIALDIDVTIGL